MRKGEYPLGKILICGRKMRGLTQAEVAGTIEVNQSTYSRMEANSLVPSAFQWNKLSDLFEIPLDALKYEYLDKTTIAEIRSGSIENGFTLPDRYSSMKLFKVRDFLPLFQFIKTELGELFLYKAIDRMEIDRDFFTSLDNQVNFNFLGDILKLVGKDGVVAMDVVTEIARYLSLPESHGALACVYSRATSQMDLIKKYVENSAKYQTMFIYEIQREHGKSVDLSIQLNHQLSSIIQDHDSMTLSFIEDFRELALKKFSLFEFEGGAKRPSKEIKLKEKESIYWNDDRTLYRLTCA